jgi:hypothetical protein
MAKAQYHKNQRVYVRPVGTWALVEKVIPHWTKGLDEPLRVYYDVGLGREFAADELQAEEPNEQVDGTALDNWRIIRARNKWQPASDCTRHPVPGTYPVVVTGEAEWGGWRVPGAEYDLDPQRVERQARLIASAPRLMELAGALIEWARKSGEEMPTELTRGSHAHRRAARHSPSGLSRPRFPHSRDRARFPARSGSHARDRNDARGTRRRERCGPRSERRASEACLRGDRRQGARRGQI